MVYNVTSHGNYNGYSEQRPKQKSKIDLRVILAFAAIYVLWGSTYLAIRIAVQQVPPLFAAGTRFFFAGTLLYAVMRFCGRPRPVGKEWGSLFLIGSLMFVVTYGAVFWAEQYVPSGFTSVLEATLPLITIALEVFVFRQQRFRWRLLVSIAVGFVGVLLLLLRNAQHVAILPCAAILLAERHGRWAPCSRVRCRCPSPRELPPGRR
jgi:drug/metabolite transporter (DMT)-like permease